MYSGQKYLVKPTIKYRSNYNELSGGLPHSEIHGSKLILSSPWLIAEYHVFHRLLLPRHSPNALLALDLIQKEQDLRLLPPGWFDWQLSIWSKAYFPAHFMSVKWTMRDLAITRVSVLDLDNTVVFEAICCKPPRKAGLQHRPCEQGSREGYPHTRGHQRCRYY